VWVFRGGHGATAASVVATDGTVTDGPYPRPRVIGGFRGRGRAKREEALEWAAKIAVACRCAQEVRTPGRPDRLIDADRQPREAVWRSDHAGLTVGHSGQRSGSAAHHC